ncbi:hypothetical protein TSUD_334740 [Trifolium subterraneum]|uniref:Uncharacterized protein n=1 Tax=Trifolium subterraneum TaxID=3900 RepID=A0A2Z6LGB9_TRISU|nr:hypothetical protein TSUD_334740 [Trifolium subterraneum]
MIPRDTKVTSILGPLRTYHIDNNSNEIVERLIPPKRGKISHVAYLVALLLPHDRVMTYPPRLAVTGAKRTTVPYMCAPT